ncbi:MAG: hypothetical protein V3V15_10415 [Sphingorhabdus sp.]
MSGVSSDKNNSGSAWRNTAGTRLAWIILGWFLMLVSPVIGAIPGPGFVIVFPIGLAMVLKNSKAAKRQYLKLTRRFPKYGRWSNWALRRNREKKRPPFPDIWGDIRTLFRRDDLSEKPD